MLKRASSQGRDPCHAGDHAREYAPDFPAGDWAYLARGFMIREDAGTLVHHEDAGPEFRPLSRVSTPRGDGA